MRYAYTEETADRVLAEMGADSFLAEPREYAAMRGYEINRAFVTARGGAAEVEFASASRRQDNRYLPEIYYERWPGDDEGKFKMQPPSYGGLDGDDLRMFVTAARQGAELVEHLSKLEWTKAPVAVYGEE